MSRHAAHGSVIDIDRLCDQEYMRRMRAVSKAALAVTSELALDKVLQKIVDTARDLLNARYAALGVVDEERTRLTAFLVSGMPADKIEQIGHWPRGLGLLGLLLREPHPVRIKDVSKDPRSIGFPAGHAKMTSFLGVPITSRGKVLGNFYLTDKIGRDEFSQEDEEILVLFAAHAAVAIDNARLYSETSSELQRKIKEVQRSERQARFLAELGGVLASAPARGQLDLQRISERLTESLGDASGVYLLNESDPSIIDQGAMHHDDPTRKQAAERLVAAVWPWLHDSVISGRKASVFSLQAAESPEPVSLALAKLNGHHFTSVLGVPVAMRGNVYGVLVSLASQPLQLTQDDLLFAAMVADRLAVAINNIQLYQQLYKQNSLLESILDTMSDVLYVAEPSGNLILFNRSFGQMIAAGVRTVPEYSISKLGHLLNPRDENGTPVPFDDLPINRALRGETFARVVSLQTHQGDGRDRYMSLSGAPIRDDHGEITAAVIVGRDITESKMAEQSRDAYIHAISHDLRNPLTVILAQSQHLRRVLEKSGLKAQGGQSLDAIHIAAKRMNAMIQDMVDSARVAAGHLDLQTETIHLGHFVTSLLQRQAPILSPARTRLEIAPGLPPVKADPNRLERILVNLISNALKYAPPDTVVTIAVERLDGEVQLSVSDSGPGIDQDDLPHIFAQFYRAKGVRKVDGLGLGLHICKVLVEAQGGRVWVDSVEGRGSTFYFTLPLA